MALPMKVLIEATYIVKFGLMTYFAKTPHFVKYKTKKCLYFTEYSENYKIP